MILSDVNLLLYACDETAALHRPAHAWLEECLNGDEPVGFALATLVSFVRLTTHARIFERPLSLKQAVDVVDDWLKNPPACVLLPTDAHWSIFSRLVQAAQAPGALVQDAHLAATAIEHGATLYTNDRDFSRFPGVRVAYPL